MQNNFNNVILIASLYEIYSMISRSFIWNFSSYLFANF